MTHDVRQGYHIEVNVMLGGIDNNIRESLIQAWGEGFESLGIPFIPVLARFQTFHVDRSDEFQQILYAVNGTIAPEAKLIHAAVKESLANHGFHVSIKVDIYIVDRKLIDSMVDGFTPTTPTPFRKGVLAA